MWQPIYAGVQLNDIAIASDTSMYILEDYTVRQVNRSDSGWTLDTKINTNLLAPGHTICTPLINPGTSEIVIVGSDSSDSSVAWADFSQISDKFIPLKTLPEQGNVHVLPDSKFETNKIIYAGINNPVEHGNAGSIYRWSLDTSSNWDDLSL